MLQLWRCTEANALSSLFQWKQPKDLTDEFLAVNKKPIMMIIHKSWYEMYRLFPRLTGWAEVNASS